MESMRDKLALSCLTQRAEDDTTTADPQQIRSWITAGEAAHSMTGIRVHVLISGHVQGVFYRTSTQRQAHACAVKGWVRNLPDGRVEAVIEGDPAAVQRMLAWCRIGPPNAYVTDVDVQEEPYTGEFTSFGVRY
jgi:acylphosphatase